MGSITSLLILCYNNKAKTSTLGEERFCGFFDTAQGH